MAGRGRGRAAARRRAGRSAPSQGRAALYRDGGRAGRRSFRPARVRRRRAGGSRSPAPGGSCATPAIVTGSAATTDVGAAYRRRATGRIGLGGHPGSTAGRAQWRDLREGAQGRQRHGPPFWRAPRGNRDGRRERGRAEDAAGGGPRGSVMRHAGATPRAVGALPIAMVQPALGALLMAPPRHAETASAAFPPTRETARAMAAITRGTQEEGLPAEAAGSHQEDRHGPAGPAGSGGQWTNARGCATTTASRPRSRGVGVPEGLEV